MNASAQPPYKAAHKVRFVTATSLFDGHDATINVIRRILQGSGATDIATSAETHSSAPPVSESAQQPGRTLG